MNFFKRLAFLATLLVLPVQAEFRTLVSNDGKAIKAEFVSHVGGKLTIRREDGAQFEVDPAIFCRADQDAIQAWMKLNPPAIKYRLKADASRKAGSNSDYSASGYYEISLRNDGQHAVKGIKILYRVLYTSYGRANTQDDDYLLEQDLDFNRTLVLKSDAVTFSNSRYYRDDGLRGCLVRVLDPKGEVIMDWVSNEVGMRGVTWESTSPRDPDKPTQKVEIR